VEGKGATCLPSTGVKRAKGANLMEMGDTSDTDDTLDTLRVVLMSAPATRGWDCL
jgi:hypothetical protein